jgi:succinoglycan biosynthesis transport protein ExoP
MNVHSPAPPIEGEPPSARYSASALFTPPDLRRLASRFRKRLRLFSAVALAVFVGVVLFTFGATPKYTATAEVMLDTRKEQVVSAEAVLSGMAVDSPAVDTEVEVIKSRQLAERVVKALKLDQDPEFNTTLEKPHGLKAVTHAVAAMFGAGRPAEAGLTAVEAQKAHEQIVDHVIKNLKVSRAGLTYVIDVGYESEDSAKAAQIANKFADLYLLEQLEAKFDATRQATEWLNGRLQELRGQVQQDDAAVQQYKIANNLLSASGTNLTEQEISNYNTSLSEARAQAAEDVARLNTARAQMSHGSTGEDVGEALTSPVIQELRKQRAEISARVADLQGRYGERHPDMLKAKRQLSDIDAQIQQEIGRIISNLQAKAQVSQQRTASISGSLGGARGTLVANSRALVRLNELQRNADASRTLYESYLNRFKETSTQQGIEQSDSRVVSKAKIPTEQSSPKVQLNIAVGLVLALIAAMASILIAEGLDAGMTTAEDVEKRLDAAFLGSIPLLSSTTDSPTASPLDYVVERPLSAFSEAFRNLRTSILYSRLGDAVKVVAITSALPGEGKTTTSICLGRVAAQQGARVVIVDCDLRRQTVNRLLENQPVFGLLEVLSGDATLDQALTLDPTSGAYVLPLTKGGFTPKDVFGSPAMDRLLEMLRERFDFVILDTAPVLPVADTRILAPKADVLVFLARWRKTPQDAIEAAFRNLSGTGTYIAGVALTQVDLKQQSKYGYGDGGYYYTEYKKYYAS